MISDFFDIFQYPFMQRALLAGLVLGGVLAYFGIFVVLRKMSFFSDGIAHASLAGVAVGLLFGFAPLFTAVVAGVFFASLIYFLEKKTSLSADAVIGIIFTAGMALGVVLMSLRSGYQPELISFLFGNILAVKSSDLVFIAFLAAVIVGFLFREQRKLILLSLDYELAYVSGVKASLYQYLTYVLLSIAVVLGIKILGIVLISAILIIPVSTAKLLSVSFKSLVLRSLIISEAVILLGLILSYYLNLPTAALIVLVGAAAFLTAVFIKSVSAHQTG